MWTRLLKIGQISISGIVSKTFCQSGNTLLFSENRQSLKVAFMATIISWSHLTTWHVQDCASDSSWSKSLWWRIIVYQLKWLAEQLSKLYQYTSVCNDIADVLNFHLNGWIVEFQHQNYLIKVSRIAFTWSGLLLRLAPNYFHNYNQVAQIFI